MKELISISIEELISFFCKHFLKRACNFKTNVYLFVFVLYA